MWLMEETLGFVEMQPRYGALSTCRQAAGSSDTLGPSRGFDGPAGSASVDQRCISSPLQPSPTSRGGCGSHSGLSGGQLRRTWKCQSCPNHGCTLCSQARSWPASRQSAFLMAVFTKRRLTRSSSAAALISATCAGVHATPATTAPHRKGQVLPAAEPGPPCLSGRTLISRVIGPHPAPACWGVSVACQEPAAGALISVNQKYGGPPWRSREVAATLPSGPVSESSPSSRLFGHEHDAQRGAPPR